MSESNSGAPGRVPGGSRPDPGVQDVRRDNTGSVVTRGVNSQSGTTVTTTTTLRTTVPGRAHATSHTATVSGIGTNAATVTLRRNGADVTTVSGTGTVVASTTTFTEDGLRTPTMELRIVPGTQTPHTIGSWNVSRDDRYKDHG